MLAHARDPKEGGARIAIIMNGSPLFTGDAGSGESEIRRFILENDLLEALIALPEQLFYNTGIATYVWVRHEPQGVRTSRQGAAHRRDLVLGADAQEPGRQASRDPARARPGYPEDPGDFKDGDTRGVTKDGKQEEVVVSRIFPTTHFGFRKITVERPLRLNFQAGPERIARLEEEKGFQALAQSKKKGERRRQGAGRGPGAAGGNPQAASRRCPTRSSRTARSSSACSTPRRRRPA